MHKNQTFTLCLAIIGDKEFYILNFFLLNKRKGKCQELLFRLLMSIKFQIILFIIQIKRISLKFFLRNFQLFV